MSTTTQGTGFRKALKRWKDRWRLQPPSDPNKDITSAPTTRPPSSVAATPPPPLSVPSPPPPPPPPPPAALFTPTTETFIHSPADPRNRSTSSSPAGTLKKRKPLSRRNTAPAGFLENAARDAEGPLNVVTTTIVGGNDKRKRGSRFRLSVSKTRPGGPGPMSSPSMGSFFERSGSRAGGRFDTVEEAVPAPSFYERSSSRAAGRFDTVEEAVPVSNIYERSNSRAAGRYEPLEEAVRRKRADSDRETLVEEAEVIRSDGSKAFAGSDRRFGIRLVEAES